jgi:hypothetical protein
MIKPQKTGWPGFEHKIATVRDFLFEQNFRMLQRAAVHCMSTHRMHIPLHKRGAAVSYRQLDRSAPDMVDFYHSQEMLHWCSAVVGERLQPTPYHDLSSCSVLIYDQAGDHIRSHRDWNFYRGRHFTILLPLINTNAAGNDVSSARLFVRNATADSIIPTPANSLVLFEGASIRHGVTPLKAGELRLILSMTYCSNPIATTSQSVQRRFKDIAYFGLRALWT